MLEPSSGSLGLNYYPSWGPFLGHHRVHLAAGRGSLEILRYLLDTFSIDPNLEDQSKSFLTPLFHAVISNRPHVIDFLIFEKGIDPKRPLLRGRWDGLLPIHAATIHEHLYIVKYFLEVLPEEKRSDVNERTKVSEKTPLHLAAQQNNLEITRYLLEKGADPQAVDKSGQIPLDYALKQKEGWLLTKLLLEHGSDPTYSRLKDLGEYPLHAAVRNKDFYPVIYLLAAGVEVDSKDDKGLTPLEVAINEKELDWDIINLLLRHGANPKVKRGGASLLALSAILGRVDTLKIVEKRSDIDFQAPQMDGLNILFLGILYEQLYYVKYLLESLPEEHRFSAHALDKNGESPLIFAAQLGKSLILLDFIQKQGVDVNARNKNGLTPLFAAIYSGDSLNVRTLLSHGAYYDAEALGMTPLSFSQSNQVKEKSLTIIEYLKGLEEKFTLVKEGEVSRKGSLFPKAKDKHGKTCYDYAKELGFDRAAKFYKFFMGQSE